MNRNASLLSFATCVAMGISSSTSAGFVRNDAFLVRDAAGGESPFADNEYYAPGSSSVIFAGAGGAAIAKTLTGLFDFELSLDGGTNWDPFTTLCLEPTQDLAFSPHPQSQQGELYKLDALANVGFTPAEQHALEVIWQEGIIMQGLGANPDAVSSAALQAIVWEFREDDDMDFSNGLFRLDNVDAFTVAVEAKAKELLNKVDNEWTHSVNMFALVSPGSQDLLYIPEPGVITLSIFGGLSMVRLRRRTA